MSVREYIGARYVPVFSDPIQWDNTNSYEPLTVVMNEGTSYVSKQGVPVGIDIDNDDYWLKWADYNAQIEAYREEVTAYNGRITALENGVPISDFSSSSTVKDAIDTIEANNWVTTQRIADENVTTAKIADESVTTAKIADNAINSSKIVDNSITVNDIVNGVIQTEMVVIGDSYSTTGYTPTLEQLWWNDVAKQLNLTPHSYAASGTGFVHGNPTFYDQLVLANNDISFNNERVKYVFIFGGLNDVNDSNVGTAATNAFRYAKQQFPHSVIFAGIMPSWVNTSEQQVAKGNEIAIAARENGIAFSMFNTLLVGEPTLFSQSNGHPNVTGQQVIASKFMSCLMGGTCILGYKRISFTEAVNGTVGTLGISIINNQMVLTGTGTTDANGLLDVVVPYGLEQWIFPSVNINQYPGLYWMNTTVSNKKCLSLKDNSTANRNIYAGSQLGVLTF